MSTEPDIKSYLVTTLKLQMGLRYAIRMQTMRLNLVEKRLELLWKNPVEDEKSLSADLAKETETALADVDGFIAEAIAKLEGLTHG